MSFVPWPATSGVYDLRRGRLNAVNSFKARQRELKARSGYSRGVPETERPLSPEPNETEIDRELRERFEAAYDENGVDRSLIRWCLAQSVTDRVRALEETLNALETVRRLDRKP